MKNYRKFLIPIVLVVLLVLGVSRLDIQSVKNHDMADDNIVAEESDKSSDNDTSSEIKEDENSLQQDDKNDIGRSEDKTDSGDIASDEKEEGKNLKKKNTSKKDALKNGSSGESKKSKKESGLKGAYISISKKMPRNVMIRFSGLLQAYGRPFIYSLKR